MYVAIAIRLLTIPFEPRAWTLPLSRQIIVVVVFIAFQAFYLALTFYMARASGVVWRMKWLLPLLFGLGLVAATRNFHDHYLESPYWAIAHMLGFVAFGAALACYFFGSAIDWIMSRSDRST